MELHLRPRPVASGGHGDQRPHGHSGRSVYLMNENSFNNSNRFRGVPQRVGQAFAGDNGP